jgi:hypothetical protein
LAPIVKSAHHLDMCHPKVIARMDRDARRSCDRGEREQDDKQSCYGWP